MTSVNTRKKISVVIPVFNEAGNIPRIYGELCALRESSLARYELEILFSDNHSHDASFQLISELAQKDSSVKAVRLSRNFGYQANLIAGLTHCTGAAAIQLDCDGEDDPAIIQAFLEKWEEGYKVVYGIRKERPESAFLSLQRKLYYRLLNKLSSIPIPVDTGDFRLLDRVVIESVKSFREANPYLRGIVAYAGFRSIGIPYRRRARQDGAGKLSWWSYVFLGIDGICSFSKAPLSVSTWIGSGLLALSTFGFAWALTKHFIFAQPWPLLGLFVFLLTSFCGVQLVCLGILGLYVGRILDESKRRPLSVVEQTIGIPGGPNAS